MLWAILVNTALDSVAWNRRDDDYDVCRDPHLFADLSGQNQRQSMLLRGAPSRLAARRIRRQGHGQERRAAARHSKN
jgi:hypothetical protein